MYVRCKRDWSGVFRRTIAGRRLEFIPGEAVEVTAEVFEALRPDLGRALEAGELIGGRFKPVADGPAASIREPAKRPRRKEAAPAG